MTGRKKRGIGELITGLVFLAAGFISIRMDVDPSWLPTVFEIVGVLATVLGFVTVFPDRD